MLNIQCGLAYFHMGKDIKACVRVFIKYLECFNTFYSENLRQQNLIFTSIVDKIIAFIYGKSFSDSFGLRTIISLCHFLFSSEISDDLKVALPLGISSQIPANIWNIFPRLCLSLPRGAGSAVVIIYVLLSVDQSVGACFFHTRTHMAHLFYDRMNILCSPVSSSHSLRPPSCVIVVVFATVFFSKLVRVRVVCGLLFPPEFPRSFPGSMYFRFVVKRALRVAASLSPFLRGLCVCLFVA